jgi:DNA-binding NarL/FixJ family response regulator
MSRASRAIAVISDALFFREALSDILGKARFRNVVAISRAQLPSACLSGMRLGVAFLDLHQLSRIGKVLSSREIVGDLRACWSRAKVVAIGSAMQLAAQAASADVRLDFGRASPRLLVDIARAAVRRRSRELESLVASAGRGGRWPALSRREYEVLDLLSGGSDNLKIAAVLGVCERAIKAHVTSLLRKLHADNRTELAVAARDAGFGRSAVDLPFRTE